MPDKPLYVEFEKAGAASQKDAARLFDERYGIYKSPVDENHDTESKLPVASMPKFPDPSPFKVGPG